MDKDFRRDLEDALSSSHEVYHTLPFIKREAKRDAIKYVYTQMYKHQMRYEPRRYQNFFKLPDDDVKAIENHFQGVDQEIYLVTVNLPGDDFDPYHSIAKRCSRKCYMKDTIYSYELGKEGCHAHIHYLFKKKVEWLAKSRIIDEFSKSFGVEKNFVDVKMYPKHDWKELCRYVKKEKIKIFNPYTEADA